MKFESYHVTNYNSKNVHKCKQTSGDHLGPGLKLRVCTRKIIFLFLNQNVCCGYSKVQSQCDSSFEHPNHMLKIMGKKILTILR